MRGLRSTEPLVLLVAAAANKGKAYRSLTDEERAWRRLRWVCACGVKTNTPAPEGERYLCRKCKKAGTL